MFVTRFSFTVYCHISELWLNEHNLPSFLRWISNKLMNMLHQIMWISKWNTNLHFFTGFQFDVNILIRIINSILDFIVIFSFVMTSVTTVSAGANGINEVHNTHWNMDANVMTDHLILCLNGTPLEVIPLFAIIQRINKYRKFTL